MQDYKTDLTTANEHTVCCVAHPTERAIMCDLDEWERKVPVCEACWRARYPRIRLRLASQRLILGGVEL